MTYFLVLIITSLKHLKVTKKYYDFAIISFLNLHPHPKFIQKRFWKTFFALKLLLQEEAILIDMGPSHRRVLLEVTGEIKTRMSTIADLIANMEQMLAQLKGD